MQADSEWKGDIVYHIKNHMKQRRKPWRVKIRLGDVGGIRGQREMIRISLFRCGGGEEKNSNEQWIYEHGNIFYVFGSFFFLENGKTACVFCCICRFMVN